MPIRGLRNRTGFWGASRPDPDARVTVATVSVKKPGQQRQSERRRDAARRARPAIDRLPVRQFVAGPAPTYLAFFSFFARRASRYFLIAAFGRSLCFAQTIPKTGAARFVQPGTGQS